MADLRRLWRRDPEQPGYLGEEDIRALERQALALRLLIWLAVLAVVIAYTMAGFAGLVVTLSAVAAGLALVIAFGVPSAPPRRTRRRRRPGFVEVTYPSYHQVLEQVSWAEVSPRHYDIVTRPLLVRLLASRLTDRHGIDLHRDPGRARDLVGDEVWWWLDPDRPPEGSSQAPGVDPPTLTRVVDRLEAI